MKKVFLDNLPKWGKQGKGKEGTINWKESIGHKIPFIYDNIQGEIEIIDYEVKGQRLYIKYLNSDIFQITMSSLLKCKLGRLLGRVTITFKVEIGTQFKDYKRDIVIIDKEYRNNLNNKSKWYKYKCNKCGYDNGWIIENSLLNNKSGCSCCCLNPTVVVQGINDIPTTDSWMIQYFQGGYNEAKNYTHSSSKKIKPICPDCGNIKDKYITIASIYNYHSINCFCGDKKPYTEKIMYNALKQLNIEFITELSKTTFSWCNNYRYDFYIQSFNCIIETHGKQHYKQTRSNGFRTLEEEQENDKLKEKLAKENGISNYIVIDCSKSELNYIKNNIINSALSEIFDLSKINWIECEKYALSNLVKIVCDYKRNNPELGSKDISNITNLNRSTVISYLKRGTKLGWCNYDANAEKGKSIEVYKDNKLIGTFPTCIELSRKSEEVFGVKLHSSQISKSCRSKNSIYKGFVFKYA